MKHERETEYIEFAESLDQLDRGLDTISAMLNKHGKGTVLFGVKDNGDIIGVKGQLFTTRTGELTIKVKEFTLLCKSLRTLPEKFHGLTNVEQRYRQRYLDLMTNPDSMEVFRKRFAILREVRNFLSERDFVEVETPMMQPIPGGASAAPFKTYYEALSTEMYMRIAPELYLKRLLQGMLQSYR